MKIFLTDTFSSNLKSLPLSIKRLYKKQERVFVLNWKDPRLHIKQLKGENSVFSFRITRRYRVLLTFIDKDTALFVSMGHRKNIYN